MIRQLKYYEWSFENGKATLWDKRGNNKMVLPMDKADSFARAYISFKNCQKKDEKNALRDQYNQRLVKHQERIKKLIGMIGDLRAKNKKEVKANGATETA